MLLLLFFFSINFYCNFALLLCRFANINGIDMWWFDDDVCSCSATAWCFVVVVVDIERKNKRKNT